MSAPIQIVNAMGEKAVAFDEQFNLTSDPGPRPVTSEPALPVTAYVEAISPSGSSWSVNEPQKTQNANVALVDPLASYQTQLSLLNQGYEKGIQDALANQNSNDPKKIIFLAVAAYLIFKIIKRGF